MYFGLLGKSLSHSFSQKYFSEKFEVEDLNHQYFNCELEEISDFPKLLKERAWRGFNVTIPYKEKILDYVDSLNPEVEAIGACNTILIQQGKLHAFNTDFLGFQESLKQIDWPVKAKRALILGSGGASKAVQFALEQEGCKVDVASRNPAASRMEYFQAQSLLSHFDLVVNATPIGTFPKVIEIPPLRPEGDLSGKLFYDLIYNPEQSQWLKLAREKGAITLNGLPMLKAQAEAAWRIWNKA